MPQNISQKNQDGSITTAAPNISLAPQSFSATSDTPTPTVPTTISSDALAPTPSPYFKTPEQTPVFPVSSLPSVDPLKPTAPEDKANALSGRLQEINNALTGKAADTTKLFADQGYGVNADGTPNDPALTDLSTQLTQLQNEAKAIPQQLQVDSTGRGITTGGLAPLETARLRTNAIAALGVSSLVAARQGKLAYATQLVTNAIQQKYGPLEAELKAKTANLDLILKSPDYTLADKNRATIQKAQIDQQTAALDVAKQNAKDAQTETLKYASVADAQTLSKMQQATSPAQVAQIAATAGYAQPNAGRYKDSITTTTDAFGNSVQHVRIFDSITGKFVDNAPKGASAATLNAASNGGSTGPLSSTSTTGKGLDFAQYGLLAKTDFNPTNQVDQLAQKYLDGYIKNGTVPTASTLGRGIKPGAFAQIDTRARDLYFKATGQAMPTPEIIKGYQQQLIGNNKLLNNLNVQEGTIGKNAALLLTNLTAANLNNNAQPINAFIDGIRNMLGDPNVATYLAQNVTVGNELGSLLSLKNAQGTTVHDKLEAAGLINKNDSQAQIAAKVKVLLQEAVNAHDAIAAANADLYKQTDPLLQDANNPARASYSTAANDPLKVIDPTGTIHTFKDKASADGFRKAAGL